MADFLSNCVLFLILALTGCAWLLAGWYEEALHAS